MASIGLRNFYRFLRNAWDKEPIIVVSVVFGAVGMTSMLASPYTYKQADEMDNWPTMYNFYNLPTEPSRVYEKMSVHPSEQPTWKVE
ncbi:NADH dehydrogenase [ubiquinone] 1 alpha subcomplex subunit 3-like [Hydractinia symbiolongicarpus]|uniref:NADH dehydrogenase [ubiquinone] 1 alpha subcomplex subunit 3-like n=1 Tax=Hydractinia symbiolongicarpus TaxID=13093 RepID=UPI002550E235|nr:NADH dehydrogenase [ubiquinone] 1 alpha subcomplex subunit 3-like [Hydractinia symbiolongicarpus]